MSAFVPRIVPSCQYVLKMAFKLFIHLAMLVTNYSFFPLELSMSINYVCACVCAFFQVVELK